MKTIKIIPFLAIFFIFTQSFATKKIRKSSLKREKELVDNNQKYERLRYHVNEALKEHKKRFNRFERETLELPISSSPTIDLHEALSAVLLSHNPEETAHGMAPAIAREQVNATNLFPSTKRKAQTLLHYLFNKKYLLDLGEGIDNTNRQEIRQQRIAQGVNALLSWGADPNSKNYKGDTPYHLAAQEGILKACDYLTKAKADVNSLNEALETPLLVTIKRPQGIDNNVRFEERNALIALRVAKLIDHGAAVNITDNLGNAPLHYAMLQGNPDVLTHLIAANADATVTNLEGQTPLLAVIKKVADMRDAHEDPFSQVHYGIDSCVKKFFESNPVLSMQERKTIRKILASTKVNETYPNTIRAEIEHYEESHPEVKDNNGGSGILKPIYAICGYFYSYFM